MAKIGDFPASDPKAIHFTVYDSFNELTEKVKRLQEERLMKQEKEVGRMIVELAFANMSDADLMLLIKAEAAKRGLDKWYEQSPWGERKI